MANHSRGTVDNAAAPGDAGVRHCIVKADGTSRHHAQRELDAYEL